MVAPGMSVPCPGDVRFHRRARFPSPKGWARHAATLKRATMQPGEVCPMTGGAAGRNQEALQARLVGLAPVDLEAVPAPVAPHRGGVSLERLAFAATGTHGVAVAPARRQPLGIVWARHDRPAARW